MSQLWRGRGTSFEVPYGRCRQEKIPWAQTKRPKSGTLVALSPAELRADLSENHGLAAIFAAKARAWHITWNSIRSASTRRTRDPRNVSYYFLASAKPWRNARHQYQTRQFVRYSALRPLSSLEYPRVLLSRWQFCGSCVSQEPLSCDGRWWSLGDRWDAYKDGGDFMEDIDGLLGGSVFVCCIGRHG